MKKIWKGIAIFAITILLTGCGGKAKIEWSSIELGDKMPKPEKLEGKITTNKKDLAIIDIDKISKKEFQDYVQESIKAGYEIDLEYENWDTVYGAFNEEGYSIRISYLENSKEMSITLKVPETRNMKEIEWPTNGLGALLPKPKSTLGHISWNNSESFIVHLGETTKDDFNEYVKACENLGYTSDYSKDDRHYRAKNAGGYEVHLSYLGVNVIEISLKAPEEKEETKQPDNNNQTGIRTEFKEAMDSYERFIDEYIAFMEKYKNSNGTDMGILQDYSKYMQKYAEMVASFEKWENESLNIDETKYYIEVQSRVSQKMINVSL